MNDLKKKSNSLKWLQAIGVDYYFLQSDKEAKILTNPDKARKSAIKIQSAQKTPSDQNKPISSYHSSIELARSLADSADSLEKLHNALLNFDGCDLKKIANKTVFADGNPKSSILFIGEAPGNNEDIQGIPFCGESGKLLDNVLASIGISRQHNAYITNTVFWRPPANRQPTQEEIDICRPFVEKHIALINPKLIILVGNVAATSLLGKNAVISKIRQEYHSYNNKYLKHPIQTTAIFHPAYLLRQPMQKKTTWYDLLKIQEYINLNIDINNFKQQTSD